MAANQGMPKDGSFSGKLLCGFAKEPNQLKKDGTPMMAWSISKLDFVYRCLQNEEKVKKALAS